MPCQAKTKTGTLCKMKCAGPLCRVHDQMGDGFFSDAKDYVLKMGKKLHKPLKENVKEKIRERITGAIQRVPRTSASTRFNKFLDKNEVNKVVKVELGRKPIVPIVHKVMDIMSLGKFSKTQKEKNYSSVYHNFLLITLSDGKTYKLEKNETVIEKTATKDDYKNEVWEIPMNGKDLTL